MEGEGRNGHLSLTGGSLDVAVRLLAWSGSFGTTSADCCWVMFVGQAVFSGPVSLSAKRDDIRAHSV